MVSTSIAALTGSDALSSLGEGRLAADSGLVATFPVFRQGKIVSGADELSVSETAEITSQLERSEPDIAVLERAAVEEFGGTNFRLTDDGITTSREVKVRRQTSPIVDFPNFLFELGIYTISSRCCVTVCTEDRRSKIWTRFRLHARSDDARIHFSPGAASGFFREIEPLSEVLAEYIRRGYQTALSAIVGPRTLRSDYNVVLKALDFEAAAADLFLSYIVFGRRLSEVVLDKDMQALWKFFIGAFDLPHLAIKPDDTSEEFRKKLRAFEPWIVDTSYDQRGFYLAEVGETYSNFWGFGRFVEPDASRWGPNTSKPGALPRLASGVADGVSVRLINQIGEGI